MTSKIKPLQLSFRKGFTFIELLVVLAVLLILASIAVPAFRAFQRNNDVQSAAEEIVSTLRLAQSQTLASQDDSQYGVYFDTSTLPNKYVLFKGQSYSGRDASSDVVYSIPDSMEIYSLDLNASSEVVFEKITGYALLDSSFGEISLSSQDGKTANVYVENSGLAGLDKPILSSDTGRLSDWRHVHFNYNREISTSTESVILNFSTFTQEIPIAGNLLGGQFYWNGTVNVDGSDQKLEIQTLRLDSPDTIFCVHRDARYNDKPLSIELSGDNSGSLIDYTAAGDASRGTSVNLTLGTAGDPQKQ